MKNFNYHSSSEVILADVITPVGLYLKIRDQYPNSILLESSDSQSNANSISYICCNPVSEFLVEAQQIKIKYPDGTNEEIQIEKSTAVVDVLHQYANQFTAATTETDQDFISNGLFGYIAYDGIQYFEKIKISKKDHATEIPAIYYAVYQNIIAIDHYKNVAHIINHSFDDSDYKDEIIALIQSKNLASYPYKNVGEIKSNLTDEDFKNQVKTAVSHVQKGDVFQLVLSRRFQQEFAGDEFNVYRALRSINPSPYLFYFDYGNFKIFGSSPEAQLIVKNNKAEIHPIAGTFKRTGDDLQDAILAQKLVDDPKENSEHIMLVDLARNDLSKNGNQVCIEKLKEVQYFSHVIHLVSKVTSILKSGKKTLEVVADTFPAGTLSGAPKYRALELIQEIETTNRNFYGGAIGFMDFKGNFNHAIIIRSFLSKKQNLYFQAGAGIVQSSDIESENQEVYNKLGALKKALQQAEKISL